MSKLDKPKPLEDVKISIEEVPSALLFNGVLKDDWPTEVELLAMIISLVISSGVPMVGVSN